MIQSKIKFIIFDLGGVLIKIHPEKFFKKVCKNASITPDKIIIRAEESNCGIKLPQDILEELKNKYGIPLSKNEIIKSFQQDWIGDIIMPMEKLINKLIREKYKVCILSNTNKLHMDYVSPMFNDFKHYHKVYLSYKLRLQKPGREIFEYILNDLQAKPEEILFIDDSEVNIKAAASLGMKTIKVRKNKPDVKKIRKILNI